MPMRILTWSLVVSAAAGLVAGTFIAGSAGDSGLVTWIVVGATPFLAITAYLLARRPDQPVARLLAVTAATAMAYPAALEALVKSSLAPALDASAFIAHQALTAVGIAAATVMIGLFPSGRATTKGERIFVRAAWAIPVVVIALMPSMRHVPVSALVFPDHAEVTNPLFVETLRWLAPAALALIQLLVGLVFAGLVLLVHRYRSTEALRRRQIRWVAYAAAATLCLSAVPWVLGEMGVAPALTHGALAFVGIAPVLLLPASIAIALLQPPWIDTDAVIRRSAAYGALSVAVLLLYAALAAAFGVAAGRRMPVELAIVVTVVVAIAFHPARMRLQRLVDRWVYGDQPTRFDAVADFERTIHAAGGTAEISHGLADTVRRALRLSWAEVEIPPEPSQRSGTVDAEPSVTVPIHHRGEVLGWIRCGRPTRRLRTADRDLLTTLAAQTALAVYNAALAARVVHAQEEERRRIERNIHDGAQQELVALVAKLGLARAQAARGALEESTLAELQDETKAILRDLRSLAQGIHPSVLTDGGLMEAIQDRAGRLPIPVTVEASPCLAEERFDMDIEGAAYFFVTEALANVLKHSAATRATVTLGHVDTSLELVVGDDGVGFDPAAVQRNGLAGLADRIAALAGTVSLEASPGSGTVLRASLPVGAEHR